MRDVWIDRFNACSRARARYWWLLAIASLFYLALTSRLSSGSEDLREITLPFLGMPLDTVVVWASGPTVIALLILGILGAFKARVKALKALAETLDEETLEAVEHALTFIDFLAYEPENAWAVWRALKAILYPLAFSLFFSEALYLLWQLWHDRDAVQFWQVFVILGAITSAAAGVGIARQWLIYFGLVREIIAGNDQRGAKGH